MVNDVSLSEFEGPLGELVQQCKSNRDRFEEFKLWLKKVRVRILKLVTTVHVCGAKRFVARGAFGKDNPAGIKFYLWGDFSNNFLDKIEEDIPAGELAIYTLTKGSVDGPIREELTSAYEETKLAYLYELVSRQPNGEAGPLLTDGGANIFYIRDAKGQVWTVRAYWGSAHREWVLRAYSVANPVEWFAGNQVVSQASRS